MTVIDRFLKLVSYPTTSDERSETCPSTPQQRVLAEELVRQMQDMGIADAHVDADGYVYGTIPANCEKDIPVYGLIAHMDTAPDAPGENIRARVTEAYDGGDVVLNEEKHIVLSPEEYPQLKNAIGKRLIVTDGTTLLGADDKAGVAEILSAAELLLTSDRKHGTVKLAFTPDEEIGRGADRFRRRGLRRGLRLYRRRRSHRRAGIREFQRREREDRHPRQVHPPRLCQGADGERRARRHGAARAAARARNAVLYRRLRGLLPSDRHAGRDGAGRAAVYHPRP